jgi:hypothetical protein
MQAVGRTGRHIWSVKQAHLSCKFSLRTLQLRRDTKTDLRCALSSATSAMGLMLASRLCRNKSLYGTYSLYGLLLQSYLLISHFMLDIAIHCNLYALFSTFVQLVQVDVRLFVCWYVLRRCQ